MGTGARCVRTGTSGSRVCCSSFCFRDVQGLNGFDSRVCMFLPIPSINLLLPPPNEGNVNSDFVLKLQTPFKPSCPWLNRTLKSASMSTNSSPPQSASVRPSGVSRAAAAQTNPAPCFELAVRVTCSYSVSMLFFFLPHLTSDYLLTDVCRGACLPRCQV